MPAAAARRQRAQRGGGTATERRDREREQREKANAAAESEDEGPTFNIVSCALKFTEEQHQKQTTKANKIRGEVRKMAAEYSKQADEIVLNQAKELDAVWQKYAKETLEEDKARRRLLIGLAENYQHIEHIVNTLQTSLAGLEKKRYNACKSILGKAEKETNESHVALLRAVRMKKTAFNTRRIAGQKHAITRA